MTTLAGWIIATAIAADGCPIQNGLHAPAHSACSLWLVCPNRFQHLKDKVDIHRLYRNRADNGIGIG
jgi:hypothetical protein